MSQKELDMTQPHHGLGSSVMRMAAIWLVAILPALLGLVHLFVHPLCPYREPIAAVGPVTHHADEPPGFIQESQAYLRAKHASATVFSLVFIAAGAACVGLGMLGVARPLVWAFLEACFSTMAHLVSDGQGACFGPIAWTFLPFWPLIALGKGIRVVIKRKS